MQLTIHVHNLLHLAKPVNVVFLPFTISTVVIIIQQKLSWWDRRVLYWRQNNKKNSDAILSLYWKSPWENCPFISHSIFFFTESWIARKCKKPSFSAFQGLWRYFKNTLCKFSTLSANYKWKSLRIFPICLKHRTQKMTVNYILC